jgi:hypothetical protein
MDLLFLSGLAAKFLCVEQHIGGHYVELTPLVTKFIVRNAQKTSKELDT